MIVQFSTFFVLYKWSAARVDAVTWVEMVNSVKAWNPGEVMVSGHMFGREKC